MDFRTNALRVFLATYVILLLGHLSKDLSNLHALQFAAMAVGLAAAIFAHTRAGPLLYALLCAHMSIEWADQGIHRWRFEGTGGMLELTHLAFDIAFLAYLAHVQWQDAYQKPLALTLGGLALLSGLFWTLSGGTVSIEFVPLVSTLESLALGGMLGCSAYHVFVPFTTRKTA